MPDFLGLEGKRVLVAGAGGTLGAALVAGFRGAGARVGGIDLQAVDGLDACAQADLTDPEACRRSVASIVEQLGGLDVFVHCVGINDRRPVQEYADADFDRIVAVNLTSAWHTAVAALAPMRAQGSGRVIFFSSVAGRSGHKLHGPYAATKGAVNQMMRVMAHEHAADGVTVNAVAPGYMDTQLTRDYLEANPDKRTALVELIPARRFGRLEEVVGPVLFLASEPASFVTGQVLYIDGGRTVV